MRHDRPSGERKLGDIVYDKVFALIANGEFAENTRLPSETELGRRFGASRPVVREALARLRDDGLIQSRQGSGSYVTRKPDANVFRFVEIGSVSDIQRCYDFRIGFEAGAAGLAATAWQEEEMAELKAAAADLEKALIGGQLAVEADARFHNAVARATRNSYYISVQQSLDANIRFGMNLSRNLSLLRPAARSMQVQREHAQILDAILKRDAAAASQAMARHIQNARHRMFEGSDNDPA
ncbi:FadR/GntR family transcriptional regulator [Paracoccus aerius]|uniref:FadR family transcriptional regulator n=1 Tax=Paracoccus aerius TaxID=1915382 RepID=A0ABS1S973_9RHOB|nr:FadR/GntR family transcriptional regulator [Paracoccus aerius]MBL3675263.1 FadR family transcriptional regulator [Paracoccus aerius]GHG31629.1 GntR family transcriptional regulator [Paracoccus aerius]